MVATVREFLTILDAFFPGDLTVSQVLYVLYTFTSLYRVFALHSNQQAEPRQPRQTGWLKIAAKILQASFQPLQDEPDVALAEIDAHDMRLHAEDICQDYEVLYDLLGLTNGGENPRNVFTRKPGPVLCSPHLSCILCPPHTRFRSLRLRVQLRKVKVLDEDFYWRDGSLLVGHCRSCKADYYPDHIAFKRGPGDHVRRLEYDAKYLPVSKRGLWCHRKIAMAQEEAVWQFRAGWANYAKFLNALVKDGPRITCRQSQRLFLEHFSRRLLVFHGLSEDFVCPARISTALLATHLRSAVGKDGGHIYSSLHHGCMDCTHQKRYRVDLVNEGAILGENQGVVAEENELERENNMGNAEDGGEAGPEVAALPEKMPQRPAVQQAPPNGAPRGYVRMAVMDGKTIGHRICALDDCNRPLVNYKNGRFCTTHQEALGDTCGIIPCGRQVRSRHELTCDDPAHVGWAKSWEGRFQRLSYPSVRRVIRRRRTEAEEGGQANNEGQNIRLPPLGAIAGNDVVHTFRAQTVYCIETVQWSCGMPIGWGKCYKSESSPQVLGIINKLWEGSEDLRPSFLCYDDACDLLRHIVTQNPHDNWVKSTKFIVDAWHYVGHRATDVLCRLWCNPAPTDGSQPDLVRVQHDAQGRTHQTRTFNTETAEQLNAWLNGYEAALRQMTDVNFDVFVHVLFMLFAEDIERRIVKKDRALPDDFWAIAEAV